MGIVIVTLQKNLQNESIKTDTKADSHSGDIAKVIQNIITATDASKVVDENGDRKVVAVPFTSLENLRQTKPEIRFVGEMFDKERRYPSNRSV